MLRHLEIQRSFVSDIQCPDPKGPNPIQGDVVIKDLVLPNKREHILSGSPQGIRSMKSHLLSLQNVQAARYFHSAEMRLDREADDRLNKIISYFYDYFSDYGSSLWRPVVWIVGSIVVMGMITFWNDSYLLAFSAKEYVGAYSWLVGSELVNRLARACYMATQPLQNPLGIWAGKMLLIPKHVSISIWLVVQALFNIVWIALFVVALRRRFKIYK